MNFSILENPKIRIYKSSFYYGEMMNGLRQGLGILVKNNLTYYEGEWLNNLKHGMGF